MKRLEEEFSDEHLTVLWIGFQDRADKIRGFADKHGIKPVGFDEKSTLSSKYGVSYGAGLIFIDSNGIVKHRVAKGFTEQALRDGIAKII